MSTTSTGHDAENRVALALENNGHEVLELNWRQRDCEIDIITEKSGVVYFTEVKFRRDGSQGSGLEYITPKKLKQMRYAAERWLQVNDVNSDAQLLAAEVDSNGDIEIVEVD